MAMVNAKSSMPDSEEDPEDMDCGSGIAGVESCATGIVAVRVTAAVARLATTGSANGNCVCAAFGDTLRRLRR